MPHAIQAVWRGFSTRLRCLSRQKANLFWTMAFPLMLATLFYFAFGSMLAGNDDFQPVPVAVADNEAYRNADAFRAALESASTGNAPLLKLTVLSETDAAEQLLRNKVDGVITVKGGLPRLTVRSSGISQSLLRTFLDEYLQMESVAKAVLATNPQAASEGLFDALASRNSYVKEISLGKAQPDLLVNYFYSLIAMAALYGSFWGIRNATDLQANLSPLGARRGLSPTPKAHGIFSDFLAALVVQYAEILLLIFYIAQVLRIPFGSNLGPLLLLSLVGSACGVSLGTFVGSLGRLKEGVKTAILLAVSMVSSFLSGLMFAPIRSAIDKTVPFINWINPASLVTDGFYSLLVYDTLHRFWLNLGILSAMTMAMGAASVLILRRKRYESV